MLSLPGRHDQHSPHRYALIEFGKRRRRDEPCGPRKSRRRPRARRKVCLANGTSLWPTQPLNVIKLAAHMGVEIISAGDLIDLARFEEPERIQAYSFSAATFEVADRMTIVFSPLRIPRPPG